ncbi:MAG: GNAT family N-acetyltransferase [Bacteroidota bacterium]|jgi:GNAT superfamily N-acetyltransferase
MTVITTAGHEKDLQGILALQQRNLKKHLSEEEAASQGFLIAEFSMDYLQRLHEKYPPVIARLGDAVVGYAIIVTKENRQGNPLIEDLFNQIDELTFDHIALKNADYAVVAQLCVDKSVRGQGLVQQLYGQFRKVLEADYAFGITDVACANTRSLKAHLKTGFQVIHTIGYGGLKWDVVLWDWRKKSEG